MTTFPVLTSPRTDKEFILDTDDNNEGTGDVLSQKIGNEECAIAYFSRSLGNLKASYLVVFKGFKNMTSKSSIAKDFLMERQMPSLEDPVKRAANITNSGEETEFGGSTILARKRSGDSATKRCWALWNSLHLKDGVLYRKWASDDGRSCRCQLILPKSRIKEVLRETHDSSSRGHFEVMKTLSKTRDSLQRYNVGEPFERMALDILGPFPVTTKGNRYVLVLMNYFAKWPGAIHITDQEDSTVAEDLFKPGFRVMSYL
ncbi:hypothetical protein AVEN_49486-1 [Araneus ventricosus]|uniref:Reverse transcriptase/retrotransposon-derived protein RNase H-like domain-containing protein n=1 Tax=Araneus ventricosus TaxID=182803 RepID=A0A4Y2D487_ARAVE|nr:hypothetical protein AVEN_49486-1 [Araneus ventricosus]